VRLVEKYYTDFVRSGANLSAEQQVRLKQINAELASLGHAVRPERAERKERHGHRRRHQGRTGWPADDQIAAAAEAAKARKLEGKYVLPLMNYSQQPQETYLQNRALRQKLQEASLSRNSRGNQYDNREIVSKVVKLRTERAKMLGYPNYAAYALENETAKNPEAVNAMLGKLAPAAVANARREAADMQALIDKEGGKFQLQSWDWAYYAEKVRQARYNFDESQLKPYLELDNVQQNGVFYCRRQAVRPDLQGT
jgi:peptidyl-dipeptidase Dcp